MKFSLRSVAIALFIFSIATLGTSLLSADVSIFSSARNFTAAVLLSDINIGTITPLPQSTPMVIADSSLKYSVFPVGIEVTAFYTLILSALILVGMEFYKPHFLKKFLKFHRFA